MSVVKKENVLGIQVGLSTLSSLTDAAREVMSERHRKLVFACANPHSVVVAQRDQVFKDALNNADQLVADGVGLILLGRLFGQDLRPRVTGHDYFVSVMKALDSRGGGRVFFLGSTDKVLEQIRLNAEMEYPNLDTVSTYSPPFGDWGSDVDEALIERINAAKPDVLWVGMTAPKQEKWVHQHRDALNVSVIGSIGAVFDFFAGTHKRAPEWMHKNGLEWLHRLLSEPRRMWRRNFVSTPCFVWMSISTRLFTKRS